MARLFVTALAYQAVHALRLQLRDQGETRSWSNLRVLFATMQRVTSSSKELEGRLALRVNSRPSTEQALLLAKLKLRF